MDAGHDAQGFEGPGRVYDGLVIQGTEGDYCLTISNDSHGGRLEDLERQLYDYGITEGYITAPTQERELIDALHQLCEYVGGSDANYGHPCRVAHDLLTRIYEE